MTGKIIAFALLLLAGCGQARTRQQVSTGSSGGETSPPTAAESLTSTTFDAAAVQSVKAWTCYWLHAARYGYRCRIEGVVARRTAEGWEWGVLRGGGDVSQTATVERAESVTQLFPVPAAQVAQLERALHGTLVPDEPSTPPSGSSLLVRIQLSNRVVEVHFPEGQALFDAAAPPADHEAFGSADLREVATRLVSSYRGWERTR